MSVLSIVWDVLSNADDVARTILLPSTKAFIDKGKELEEEGANEEEIKTATEKSVNQLVAANEAALMTPDEIILTPEEIAAGKRREEKLAELVLNEGFAVGEQNPDLYGTASVITDPGMLAAGRLAYEDTAVEQQDWAAVTTGNMPRLRGAAPPRDTLGFQDVPYVDYIEGSLPQQNPLVVGRGLGWEIDESRIADGQSFIRSVERNVPFTVRDAMTLYDAQDPNTQKLIAQSLAIGTGDKSFMANALGDNMFRDPSIIYDRESVMLGLLEMANEISYRAGLSGGGMDAYEMIKTEIPKLRAEDFAPEGPRNYVLLNPVQAGLMGQAVTRTGLTLDLLSDELFDLAANTGVVKLISQTHSRALASDIYRRVVGREPDEVALTLFDEWSLEAQQNNMGVSRQPTDTEMKSYFGEQIIKETEEGGEFQEEKLLIDSESAMDAIFKAFGSRR